MGYFGLAVNRESEMKVRLLLCILFLFFLTTCATLESPSEISPDQKRYLRLQTLINRIGAPGFHPEKGERLYPFTYTFRKAEGGEIVRQGEGFVLVNDPLWCLVRRWRDSITGNPGQRMLICMTFNISILKDQNALFTM